MNNIYVWIYNIQLQRENLQFFRVLFAGKFLLTNAEFLLFGECIHDFSRKFEIAVGIPKV